MKSENKASDNKITMSSTGTGLLIIFLALIIFHDDSRALFIQAAMKAGLFQPNINNDISDDQTDYSGIQFKDKTGKVVALSDLKGKVLFINFWANWCPPCKAEMPSIENLYKNSKDVAFLMVDVEDDYRASKKYMDGKGFTLPIYSPVTKIPEGLYSGTLPTTVVLNKNGLLVFKHEGTADYHNKKFRNYLKGL